LNERRVLKRTKVESSLRHPWRRRRRSQQDDKSNFDAKTLQGFFNKGDAYLELIFMMEFNDLRPSCDEYVIVVRCVLGRKEVEEEGRELLLM
jgi:hypothetical protein